MASANGASAARGPGFVQYLALLDGDSSTTGATEGVQRLVFVLDGHIDIDGEKLVDGGYAYLPADSKYQLKSAANSRLLVFEKPYVAVIGIDPPKQIIGHVSNCEAEPFLGDEDARLACLLPTDHSFDMAVNVFTYQPGAALPFVETHIMEHGLYMSAVKVFTV